MFKRKRRSKPRISSYVHRLEPLERRILLTTLFGGEEEPDLSAFEKNDRGTAYCNGIQNSKVAPPRSPFGFNTTN